MREDLGQATDVENQHDDTKDKQQLHYFEFSLGVHSSRLLNPRGRTRLRRPSTSHTDTSERAHVFRVVIHVVRVRVKVPCVKSEF